VLLASVDFQKLGGLVTTMEFICFFVFVRMLEFRKFETVTKAEMQGGKKMPAHIVEHCEFRFH